MNADHEMTHEEIIRTRLEVMRRQHRELDEQVSGMSAGGVVCSLTLGWLKKEKLVLKDQIARLEDELTPDIIA